MKSFLLMLSTFTTMMLPAAAQQQPSGAMQLLGRCTLESATIIDQLNAAQVEISALKAEVAKLTPAAPPKQ